MMTSNERYKAAGVDIDAGNRAVDQMKPAIRATHSPNVLADVGSFGGLFALTALPDAPVLVASIDGVGTKVKLAAQAARLFAAEPSRRRTPEQTPTEPISTESASDDLPQNRYWRAIGHDLVNHCVNDILVQNARPLFFLDYVAASRLEPETVAQVVIGMAEACRAANCALLGGETAEMPGVYTEGALDVAGAIVGLVDRNAILPDQAAMRAGDLLVGLPSSGPHTNGYSLIRRALADDAKNQPPPNDENTQNTDGDPISAEQLSQVLAQDSTGEIRLVDALLAPHRSYLTQIDTLAAAGLLPKGMAHITGGGFFDNVPRILPEHLAARIDSRAWTPPPVFQLLVELTHLEKSEAYRVFNMGIGMVLVVERSQLDAVLERLPEATVIGELIARGADDAPFVLI
jgi:phosphoribosylformylglycinamidine cyclo-ligase